MKYEYQDLIVKTLLKDYENRIDKTSLKNAEIVIANVNVGACIFKDTDYSPCIIINHGSILNVLDNNSNELSIYFTVYVISVDYDNNEHYLCHIDVS